MRSNFVFCSRRLKTFRNSILPLALLGLAVPVAFADVQTTGIVDPARNPFDTGTYPGLPVSGNFINPIDGNTAALQQNFERTLDINIGQTSPVHTAPHSPGNAAGFGEVLISSNTQLRYQNVIIGGSAQISGTNTKNGTGVFRIDGFGALFNNDPTILPFGLDYQQFGSQRSASVGYDVYVGQAGTGTLEISAGGRAEIQDAVVVGDAVGSLGSVTVDGFDSFLGNGGFSAAPDPTIPHQMIVGRLGTGKLVISAGGTVNSEGPSGGAGQNGPPIVGATIGSGQFKLDQRTPDPGGLGIATVTGAGSKWAVGGTLQVGGFSLGLNAVGGANTGDPEGDDTFYDNSTGRGTLQVSDSEIVNIHNPVGVPATDTSATLFLAIGRFGRVELNGGTITLGGTTSTGSNQFQGKSDFAQVINDGVITGTGRIETGVFRNRDKGQVNVLPGQSLTISAGSAFLSSGAGTTPPNPLESFGAIQVIGTLEAPAILEFDRIRPTALAARSAQRFKNFQDPAAADGGIILGKWSILRFRSDMENFGTMAFEEGVNIITGDVFNQPTGKIKVQGAGTRLVFQDSFANGGTITGPFTVLAPHSFTNTGTLAIDLNPDFSPIEINGDAGLTGSLAVTLSNFPVGSLHIGDTFKFLTATGSLGGVDFTDPANPHVDLSKLPLFTSLSVTPFPIGFGLPSNAFLRPFFTSHEAFLQITTTGTSVGPDFNGDGVVDMSDFLIWQSHVGILTGATVLDGDADGDGDVDGNDFLKWQRNVGKPMPWNGAGSGSGSNLAIIPEPTSLMLLACGSLALAFSGRRSKR